MAEYRLSNAEREVILSWTADDDTIHVTAEIPAFNRLLLRRGYRPDPDGFFRIPVSALRIAPKDRARRPGNPAALQLAREKRAKQGGGGVQAGLTHD